MPTIISVGEYNPPYELKQELTVKFARNLFQDSYPDIDRLLQVFKNGDIKKRHFSNPLEWYKKSHSFEEKNNTYIDKAVEYGVKAVRNCLQNSQFLKKSIPYEEIDAFIFISTTGISTPSIDVKIMNALPFSSHSKRIPIWGLGCAGGASGLARAFEFCKAYPKAKVLVLSVELCSLTFQKDDMSKSNIIGTSLFADGVSCACVVGDEVEIETFSKLDYYPNIIGTHSTLMKDSEDVMGWNIKNKGLFVIFSKSIPVLIKSWLKENITDFLKDNRVSLDKVSRFIAHPGGKKVLDAYESSLEFSTEMTAISRQVLKEHGNMSSATILYVLKRFMESRDISAEEFGLVTALGPGFSCELLLVQWR